MSTVERARELQGELAELRRALHREPELGLHLPRTQEKVLAALDGLPLEISTGRSLSSVTAVLRGTGAPGGAVLLRGDMDALPVQETTGLDYASRIDGRMHACGHDLHTAGLVGAARLLCDRREQLSGDVVFMFQPGEEGFNGAGMMIDEGVLDAAGKKPDAAYAIHVTSSQIPCGAVYARPGAMMSACDELRVTVRGRGGHGSSPHRAKDPVPAVCEMVTALQTHVTRTFDVFDPVVVTVGRLSAGSKSNIIPESAAFDATVRSYSAQNRELLRTGLPALVEGIARAHGLEVEVEYEVLFPVTVNSPDETGFALDTARELLGAEAVLPAPNPINGSEDFSLVLEQVPGAMLFLGAVLADRDPRTAPTNHAPSAAFDDAVLSRQAALLADLATRRLAATAG
ncbi:M20 metallopeptidase family protein [Kitasatospora sp. NPDC001175]|uniref:M20 metallopeptidase family protein n=1 Tax=Kitasatospora sp. NPDC001175 TaxID=3157103 RepID=UPI003D05E1A0